MIEQTASLVRSFTNQERYFALFHPNALLNFESPPPLSSWQKKMTEK